MSTGIVKWFDAKKGFGFITDGEGKEYFVHFSSILGMGDAFKKLNDGDKVAFEVGSNDKGECAINVVVENIEG